MSVLVCVSACLIRLTGLLPVSVSLSVSLCASLLVCLSVCLFVSFSSGWLSFSFFLSFPSVYSLSLSVTGIFSVSLFLLLSLCLFLSVCLLPFSPPFHSICLRLFLSSSRLNVVHTDSNSSVLNCSFAVHIYGKTCLHNVVYLPPIHNLNVENLHLCVLKYL